MRKLIRISVTDSSGEIHNFEETDETEHYINLKPENASNSVQILTRVFSDGNWTCDTEIESYFYAPRKVEIIFEYVKEEK